LAAAQALTPFVFSGCEQAPQNGRVPIGLLQSETGPAALIESPLRDAARLAVDEINLAGGVLGREIEPIEEDGKSRFLDAYPKAARKLLMEDQVAAIFGCWSSASRKAVLPIVEELDGLLFYPLQFEGNETSRNIVYTGMTASQQVFPLIDWLLSDAGGGRSKYYLVGSDYVFPWTVHYLIHRYREHLGDQFQIVGFDYLPIGQTDYRATVQQIKELAPDAIINSTNGIGNLFLFEELHRQQLKSKEVPVFSTSVGENQVNAMPVEQILGNYSVWSYFQSLATDRSREFVRRYQAEFGEDRVVNDPMEASYAQIYLWKAAVEKAGTFKPEDVRQVLNEGLAVDAPSGQLRIDPRTHYAYKYFRLGRVNAGRQFVIDYESPEPIAPDPYPAFAFPGWSCDWTKGRLVKGETVVISSPGSSRPQATE
jgi:urea transport system substrate-binding protein